MKKFINVGIAKIKQLALFLTAAIVALVAMPLGMCGLARNSSASAEVATAESDESNKTTALQSAALDPVTLTVNYFRTAGDYSGWDLWVWAVGGDGDGYTFTDTTISGKAWKTVTLTVSGINTDDSGNAIGVIPRKGGSSWTDQTADIYISADMIDNNAVTIYLVDKNTTIFESAEDALASKIITANFTVVKDNYRVYFTTSKSISDKSVLIVKDSEDTVYATIDCSINQTYVGRVSATIELPETFEVDFSKTYTIVDEPSGEFDPEVNFSAKTISKSTLYDTDKFINQFKYEGELGAIWSESSTEFIVWSPVATSMSVKIYSDGTGETLIDSYAMTKGSKGEWKTTVSGNLNGKYYTYAVTIAGKTSEVVDPYARSAGRDGKRGMILNLDATDPTGWATQSNPELKSYSQAVIYEAQLRDLTSSPTSGVSENNRGKFLGLTETGTKNSNGDSTALDYLKELGVTEVHFQPLFDFASVSESFDKATYNKDGEYNWGYDPLNYNIPEGSYSSNPADGSVRVNEMKQMVMALHNAGIQVVMDVVYNHVSNAQTSNFEQLVPGYYFRTTEDGSYYNGSGCGNETASDRYMFSRFMIDSVKYWAEEYKIDGFRFDLMALHDIDTMNSIYDTVAEINPDVMIYGEGWTGGTSGLSATHQATQANASKMPNIAVFNDIVRDSLKGSVFDVTDKGYVSGKSGTDAAVYVGATGATGALASKYYKSISKASFAANPTQSINYVSAHDNSTLWDKLNASVEASVDTLKAMNRLAAAAVLTGQGPSFFLAGEEMLRSKPTTATNSFDNRPCVYKTDSSYYFSDNSYKSPDSVNAINWDLRSQNSDMIDFYKELIKIKTTFPQFQLTTTAQINSLVTINDEDLTDGVAAYAIKDPDSTNYAVVIFNANDSSRKVSIPNGSYTVYVNGSKANATDGLSKINGSSFTVGGYSCAIMVGTPSSDSVSAWVLSAEEDGNLGLALGLGIGIPVAVLAAGGAAFGVLYTKKKKGKGKKTGDENADTDSDAKGTSSDEATDAKPEDSTADAQKEENPSDAQSEEKAADAPATEE